MSLTMANKPLDGKLADDLYRRTHFTRPEVIVLINQFRQINETEGMERITFLKVLQQTFNISDELMMDRIYKVFDKDRRGNIEVDEWIAGLSIFLSGTPDERMLFCFKVFDLIGDGYITRDVMLTLLADKVEISGDEDPEEVAKSLADQVLKMMDHDGDGRISLEDYVESVEKEPLLLQAFGQCLPDDKIRMAVLATFKKTLPKWK